MSHCSVAGPGFPVGSGSNDSEDVLLAALPHLTEQGLRALSEAALGRLSFIRATRRLGDTAAADNPLPTRLLVLDSGLKGRAVLQFARILSDVPSTGVNMDAPTKPASTAAPSTAATQIETDIWTVTLSWEHGGCQHLCKHSWRLVSHAGDTLFHWRCVRQAEVGEVGTPKFQADGLRAWLRAMGVLQPISAGADLSAHDTEPYVALRFMHAICTALEDLHDTPSCICSRSMLNPSESEEAVTLLAHAWSIDLDAALQSVSRAGSAVSASVVDHIHLPETDADKEAARKTNQRETERLLRRANAGLKKNKPRV